MARKSRHEEEMHFWLESKYPGEWRREYQFFEGRRWRFDFAHLEEKLAIEIDGIVYRGQGGHQSPKGVDRDREKDAEAMLTGWKVLRLTPRMMKDGSAFRYIIALMRR